MNFIVKTVHNKEKVIKEDGLDEVPNGLVLMSDTKNKPKKRSSRIIVIAAYLFDFF
jgi:hypothetical protein